MPGPSEFILGEFQRTLDERYRLSIPGELVALLTVDSAECILAKERPGCLSLWSAEVWQAGLDEGVEMVLPGDNTNLEVELITPIAMERGLRFAIREGGRTVGAGSITEILE